MCEGGEGWVRLDDEENRGKGSGQSHGGRSSGHGGDELSWGVGAGADSMHGGMVEQGEAMAWRVGRSRRKLTQGVMAMVMAERRSVVAQQRLPGACRGRGALCVVVCEMPWIEWR